MIWVGKKQKSCKKFLLSSLSDLMLNKRARARKPIKGDTHLTSRDKYTWGISMWISLPGSWVLVCKLYREVATKLVKKRNIFYVTSQEKRIRVIKEKPYFEE